MLGGHSLVFFSITTLTGCFEKKLQLEVATTWDAHNFFFMIEFYENEYISETIFCRHECAMLCIFRKRLARPESSKVFNIVAISGKICNKQKMAQRQIMRFAPPLRLHFLAKSERRLPVSG